MPGLSSPELSTLQRAVLAPATLIIFVAPLVFGCYQPWASGFLVAGVCGFAALFAAVCIIQNKRRFPVPANLLVCAAFLCAWLALTVFLDWCANAAAERSPSLSLRNLAYVGAFAGAGMLGASQSCTRGLKRILWAFTILGLLLALLAMAEKAGLNLREGIRPASAHGSTSSTRPSGVYINANRFAVMLAMCLACALGLFLDACKNRASGSVYRRVTPDLILIVLALLATASAIGLTLSRLTLISLGLSLSGVATAWMVLSHGPTKDSEITFPPLPLQRLQKLAWTALPLTALAAWGICIFAVGGSNLNERFAMMSWNDPGADNRFWVVRAAWPLLLSAPVFGHGLGRFESIFTGVQPIDLAGRWRQLHCDWLQLALEAGWPALLLAMLSVAVWCRACWLRLKNEAGVLPNGQNGLLLRLVPMAGIAAALLCSAGDFPLREPASAMLFFFLLGALAAAPESRHVPRTLKRTLLSALSIVLLVAAAAISGRNAWACAATPWFGQIYYPPDAGGKPERWERGIELDPSDPELQFNLALAALNAIDLPAREQQSAQDAIQRATDLNPRDSRFPWLAAVLSERFGKIEAARNLRERAASLAPCNPDLRRECGEFYLRNAVKPALIGGPYRTSGVENCLRHFRIFIAAEPSREAEVAGWMAAAGCDNGEIAGLWPDDDIHSRLRRARFYIEAAQLDRADRELIDARPTSANDTLWFDVICGALALRRGENELGIKHWESALQNTSAGIPQKYEIEYWMINESHALKIDVCELLATALLPVAAKYPELSYQLAKSLVQAGRELTADRLLNATAQFSPDAAALWAEQALALGDFSAAEERAYQARRQGRSSAQWTAWYDGFCLRLKQRQEKK